MHIYQYLLTSVIQHMESLMKVKHMTENPDTSTFSAQWDRL